jgi:Rps23 Pro-64 3,4-dihydroxylase Tpa1-like proline 4-hydroxylase
MVPDQAMALSSELLGSELWLEIFRSGEKVFEMPHTAFLALPDSERRRLRNVVQNAARKELQYRYRSIRVAETQIERATRGLLLDQFADLLNASATLALLQSITGEPEIDFADSQATDYRAGDFLTNHDDLVEGKRRLAAYVFGLTSVWQADWGGLLLFDSDHEIDGYVPDFNVLRLFRVPRRHHVSYVAPWVQMRRISITGWLRKSAEEEARS